MSAPPRGGSPADQAGKGETAPHLAAMETLLHTDDMVVTLAGDNPGEPHYLKFSLSLEPVSAQAMAELDARWHVVVDAILSRATSLDEARVMSAHGVETLRQALLEGVNAALGAPLVKRIYFLDHVIQ